MRAPPDGLLGHAGFLYMDDSGGALARRFGGAMPEGSVRMHVYCLFCETEKCDCVVKAAMQQLSCIAISPKQVQHTWANGSMVDRIHDLLPGYVFVYRQDGPLDIDALQSLQGVRRCLCDSDRRYELYGNDERFALMLLHSNGVIGKTKVFREGQRIRICQGAYEGVETKILKVNHQKKRMQIEIPFANMSIKTWVEFEIVSDDLKE